ncbi:MAG: aminotransferase class I/II-fold pyridoxal phosphate-dependent enzyme, partial [Anaerolineales bacterium]
DFDNFEDQLQRNTKMFLLCNPQNPVGRVYRRDELEQLAALCLRHNVIICSDEIHGDLVFQGHRHIPIGSIDSEISARSITLHAPSKTFNIAGLKCAFAVIPDRELRRQFTHNLGVRLGSANSLGFTAALAAYQAGEKWLDELLMHLENNRDILFEFIQNFMPGIRTTHPEGTYLAWLDCSSLHLKPSPHQFFLDNARVALNDGSTFGPGGENFVRMNFGCTRSMLLEGLERMRSALGKRD